MVTPDTIYDYHLATGDLEVLKVQEIPSGYDATRYATERLMIPARDGTPIPVSIVYPKDLPRDGSAPLARKSVVSGKRVSVRVDLGGRRIIKKKNPKQQPK